MRPLFLDSEVLSARSQALGRGWLCRLLFLVLLIRSGQASADTSEPADFDRGIRVEMGDDRRAMVIRGDVRTQLTRGQLFEFSVDRGAKALDVVANDCWSFEEPEPARFTLDMLESRLENAAALRLHRAKRYAEAVPGFEKALRLDPDYLLAALNLASSLSMQGKKDHAVAALAPFLQKKLPRVYLAMMEDPELRPLLENRTIGALRVEPPGTGILKEYDPRWLSYSARHGMLAALDAHRGLVFFSVRSGERIAQLGMGSALFQYSCEGSDCNSKYLVKLRQKADALARAEFTRQRPLANRLLASLGFNPVPHREEGRACKEDYLCFRPSGLSVFLGDRGIYVYNGDKLITQAEHAGAMNGFSAAWYLPRLNAVISRWSRRDGPTDCHPQQGVELTPIDSKKK